MSFDSTNWVGNSHLSSLSADVVGLHVGIDSGTNSGWSGDGKQCLLHWRFVLYK